MAEEFDIGPLTWVKDEIDQALASVLENLATFAAKPQDTSALRLSQPHLYQVGGALDMVGLEGCRRFCGEIEQVMGALEKTALAATPETITLLRQAVEALQHYLKRLLDGAPDQPLMLFPLLRALAGLRGEDVSEAALFFPDMTITAPRDLPRRELAAAEMPAFVAGQRALFQKSLVQWLKAPAPDSRAAMQDALDQVQQVQQQAGPRTFWWLASVLTETTPAATAAPAAVKRLYRQIDQQLRDLARGHGKIASSLMRELLFHIAQSTPSTPRIRQVKALFELDALLPETAAPAPLATVDADAHAAIREMVAALRGDWSAVAEGDASGRTAFSRQLTQAVAAVEPLNEPPLLALLQALDALTRADAPAVDISPADLLVEVAASLNLLQDALADGGGGRQLQAQAERLQRILRGDAAILQSEAVSLDESTLAAVAKQVSEALQTAEQALDAFFRNPADSSVLRDAPGPLKQVIAAFDMLDMPVPARVAAIAAQWVDCFCDWPRDAAAGMQARFDLVAEGLSMLAFFAAEFPRIRPESLAALTEMLQRLEAEPPLPSADVAPVAAEKAVVPAASEPEPELLQIFIAEAEEVLAAIAQQLQALRVNATDRDALVEVRRGFHTLKGSGRTVGLAAMGEVAWAVEKLLNAVLERDAVPNERQLELTERASAAFADWIADLGAGADVSPDPAPWLAEAQALEGGIATQQSATQSAEVLIGGTRRIGLALFDIFMGEARQHLAVMRQEQQKVAAPGWSARDLIRSAHTLASTAAATGFSAIADLARALENWLDAYAQAWEPKTQKLLDDTIRKLDAMLDKAQVKTEPRRAGALLTALKKATEKARLASETQPPAAEAVVPDTAVRDETAADETPSAAIEVSSPQDQELLTIFIEEARELVPQIGNELRAWRKMPDDSERADALQRALHTLKGSARMAGQAELGDTVHHMEDGIIRALKQRPTPDDFDALFQGADRVGALLEELTGDGATERTRLASGRSGNRRAQFLRLRADVLDRLINEAGEVSIARSRLEREMQAFKQSSLDLTESVQRLRNYLRELEIETESQMQSRMTLLQETQEAFDPLEFDRFTRLQELTRMMAESVNDVSTIQSGLLGNLDETEAALQQQNRMNRELQHGLMAVRMVPFALITERLHRIVRQTARELGKPAELTVTGSEVEIDRSMLDKIGAPLEHLLRNAVGHGIESAAQRKAATKPESGSIRFGVTRENDEIVITVADDGAGIALDRVRQRALEGGLIRADQEVAEQQLLALIFEPGFSTATDITQISGRGVGLDAVRGEITGLGGRIEVTNQPQQGTTFTIYLPVTLSVVQVVLVRAGTQLHAVPAVMVEQLQKLKTQPLAEAYAAGSVHWAGRDYPLHHFARLLGEELEPEPQEYSPVLLLRSGTHRVALHVDEVIGNQEAVMKPIGPQLARVPGISGATVMGDGKIVLIVNPVQMANREIVVVSQVGLVAAETESASKPLVMVVDDSLTMRKVLTRTLEREGYRVVSAKDGMDALQLLQEARPDIMLLDIEMPRMDGFELTRNVRGDAATAGIPIIMISSRTAEKHQSHARELGVNAFLGKPVQDDDLLTEINIQLGQAAVSGS